MAKSISVGVHEAKSRLFELIRRVEAGEEIEIRRGREPLALIVPIPKSLPTSRAGRCSAFSRRHPCMAVAAGRALTRSTKCSDSAGARRTTPVERRQYLSDQVPDRSNVTTGTGVITVLRRDPKRRTVRLRPLRAPSHRGSSCASCSGGNAWGARSPGASCASCPKRPRHPRSSGGGR